MKKTGFRIWTLLVLTLTAALVLLQSGSAQDDLHPSSRVGALRIPLTSYERIPIGTISTHPDRYQMREIRVAGTVIAIHTEIITNRMVCGRVHERTALTVEDDSGQIEVIDQGACGKNASMLKAPMVTVGRQVDTLVSIMLVSTPNAPEPSIEVTLRFLDFVRH